MICLHMVLKKEKVTSSIFLNTAYNTTLSKMREMTVEGGQQAGGESKLESTQELSAICYTEPMFATKH